MTRNKRMDKKIIGLVVGVIFLGGAIWFFYGRDKKQDIIINEKKTMGLGIEVMSQGSGERKTKNGDSLVVNYTGRLADGTKFDSSLDRGVPFEFRIGDGKVIAGWEKGLLDMKVGEKRVLTVPAEMGYGTRGAGGIIPPNASLIFDVELVEIK
jgi:FKBP-type peptidyl-prolyl cis-trans isomerase